MLGSCQDTGRDFARANGETARASLEDHSPVTFLMPRPSAIEVIHAKHQVLYLRNKVLDVYVAFDRHCCVCYQAEDASARIVHKAQGEVRLFVEGFLKLKANWAEAGLKHMRFYHSCCLPCEL